MDQNHAAAASLLFRQDAARYRKLACGMISPAVARRLTSIAEECERDAALLAARADEVARVSAPIGATVGS